MIAGDLRRRSFFKDVSEVSNRGSLLAVQVRSLMRMMMPSSNHLEVPHCDRGLSLVRTGQSITVIILSRALRALTTIRFALFQLGNV